MNAKMLSPLGATPAIAIAATALTAAAVGTTAYVGGKAALTTGALIGGGLFAVAVVNVIAQNAVGLSIAAGKAAGEKYKAMKAEREAQRPAGKTVAVAAS